MTAFPRRGRRIWLVGLLSALLIAGVVSRFASAAPDGLEHVADTVGFAQQAEEHPAADSPLSGYEIRGVPDAAVSGGLAGVTGVVLVLALASVLAWTLRRRPAVGDADPSQRVLSRSGYARGTEDAPFGGLRRSAAADDGPAPREHGG